jgi:multiple antibiotic resistance protein
MSDILGLWSIFLGTFIGLLPIVDPLTAAPTFLAITEGQGEARRREQARRGCVYMVAILVGFLVAGRFIMEFFGISLPGLRIAGGILLTGLGMEMLGARQPDVGRDQAEREAALRKADISFSPLAMPMLSGPGSIAVTLGFTSLATGWVDYLAIIAGIVVMAVLTYVILVLSSRGMRFLGPIGIDAMTRIMGFLTMCIGVQFVVNGVLDPELLQRVRAGLAGG